MNRAELIHGLVLRAISNDYENVDQGILLDVAAAARPFGLAVERCDVVDALTKLLETGMAKAYILTATDPARELASMPTLEKVEEYFETYFYITSEGKKLAESNESSLDLPTLE